MYKSEKISGAGTQYWSNQFSVGSIVYAKRVVDWNKELKTP